MLTNGFVFMCIWLVVESRLNASSFKITRGEYDKIRYGEDYREMVNHIDEHTMKCNESLQECQCKFDTDYKTIILNDTQFVKCVKDKDKSLGIIGQGKSFVYLFLG